VSAHRILTVAALVVTVCASLGAAPARYATIAVAHAVTPGFGRPAVVSPRVPGPGPARIQAGANDLAKAKSARDVGVAMRSTTIVTGARVYSEASLGAVERERVARAVTRGVAQTAADLGLPFARPPEVYVFTTRGSFSLGLQRGFGQRATDANALAYAKGGVAFAGASAVVINWQATDPALSVIAHELTHLLVHEAAGVDTPIPAWFDEGLATQEQRSADTDDLASAKDASTTLAILRGNDISLTSLTTPGDWTLVDARLGGRSYAFASEAVGMVRADVGTAGLGAILERSRQVGFAQAFGESVGESPTEFAYDFPGRYVSAHGPRIAQTPTDSGVVWCATGFVPDTALHVTITGSGYRLEYDVQADRDGIYSAAFGGTAPPGRYLITVTSDGVRVSALIRAA